MDIKDFSPHIFCSYDKSSELKPEIVIRQVILYGEIKDMILLLRLAGWKKIHDEIRKWKDRDKYEKHINFFEKVILNTLQVFQKLKSESFISRFTLVGGTALATKEILSGIIMIYITWQDTIIPFLI